MKTIDETAKPEAFQLKKYGDCIGWDYAKLVKRLGGDETKYKGKLKFADVTHDLGGDDADAIPCQCLFTDEKKAGAGAARIKQHALGPKAAVDPARLAKLEARLQGATIAGAAPPAGFETPGKAAGPATFDAPPPPPP